MSEVIDAQVVDVKEADSVATADPFMDLMSAPGPVEIVEAKEDDLSPEEQAQVYSCPWSFI